MPSYYYPEPPDNYNQDPESLEEIYFNWKSKNGTIKISEMSDIHLERTINYIKGFKSCEADNMDNLIKVLLMEIELLKRKIKNKDNGK